MQHYRHGTSEGSVGEGHCLGAARLINMPIDYLPRVVLFSQMADGREREEDLPIAGVTH